MTAAAQVAPDVDRTDTRAELLAHLATLADRGLTAPCLSWPDAGWTSDDLEEQQLAASLCHDCPAVEPCHAYGSAWPKEAGVYGGLTEHDRRPALGRPRTRPDPEEHAA